MIQKFSFSQRHNTTLRIRGFLALGCLSRFDGDEVLLKLILVKLKESLVKHPDDIELILSIILCLRFIVSSFPVKSVFFKSIFWLAIAIIQHGNPILYLGGLSLIKEILLTLNSLDTLSQVNDLTKFFEPNKEEFKNCVKNLNNYTGVSLEKEFSFNVSCNLLKGLFMEKTKTQTIVILTLFVEILGKSANFGNNPPSSIGFLIALIPFTENIKSLFVLSGINDEETPEAKSGSNPTTPICIFSKHIFQRLGVVDVSLNSFLMIKALLKIMEHTRIETEKMILYMMLIESYQFLPNTFFSL